MKKAKFYAVTYDGIQEKQGWTETLRTSQNEYITINLYRNCDNTWWAIEETTGLGICWKLKIKDAIQEAISTLVGVATAKGIKVSEFLAKYPKLETYQSYKKIKGE